jgi:site-specific DNA-adenine methylase
MESSRHHTPIDYGGKRAIADVIWQALGDPSVFVDPFAGSNAILLARPSIPKVETVNDADGLLVNAWRAIKTAPEEVARWADEPVHELTLHAVHAWLVREKPGFVEQLRADPDFYDTQAAGRWLWGISAWIGPGWCASGHARHLKVPHISGKHVGCGIHQQRPMVGGKTPGNGVHRKRPMVAADRQGNGVHAGAQQLPAVDGFHHGKGICAPQGSDLHAWFAALAVRLRRVRICCGDWRRVLTPVVLEGAGMSGIVLDPPYSHADRDPRLYAHDEDIAADVAEWAREHGDNPRYRIVLCSYDTEHAMPSTWTCIPWQANGGYANQRKTRKNGNKYREVLWCSPHCETVTRQLGLFAQEGP